MSLDAARDKKPSRPSIAWLTLGAAAAALVLLGGGGVIVVLNAPEPIPSAATPSPPEPHGPPEPTPAAVAQHEAEDLRVLAKADCNAARWTDCIEKLDRASDLDPTGNLTRSVRRMRLEATRAGRPDAARPLPGSGPTARELDAPARARLATALRGDASTAITRLQLACADDPEPKRLCDQLAGAVKKAGWVVSRSTFAGADADAGMHGQRIEVATDADGATQDAADTLAEALTASGIVPRGPDDMAALSDAPRLRLTIW